MSASYLDTVANAQEVTDNEEDHPGLLAGCVSRPTQRFVVAKLSLDRICCRRRLLFFETKKPEKAHTK